MKIIELLNKIAKGEEVPKEIKYENKIYTYQDNYQDYKMFDDYGCNWLLNKIFDDFENTLSILNYEIEIIEEEKEIENQFTHIYNCSNEKNIEVNFQNIQTTLEDIIKVINDMRDKE